MTAYLAAAPFAGAGVLGLVYAWSTGRLTDCWRSLTRREPEPSEPTARERAVELVRLASRGGIFGFRDVSVELVPNGYRVVAGRVAVIYPSPANAERAITQWLTRGDR